MSSYIPNCRLENCLYCAAYDNASNWLDSEDYYDEDDDTYWQYENLDSNDLINALHGASTTSILAESKSAVNEFYKNIAADSVPEGAVEKFNDLYAAGCHMKRHLSKLLQTYAEKYFDVNVLVRERSKETNMYYYNIVGMTDGWYLSLFFASRFDVLDELKNKVPANCSILNYFNNRSIPVSDEMLEYLASYTSVDKVFTFSLPICSRKLVDALAEQKPALSGSLPPPIDIVDCENTDPIGSLSEQHVVQPDQLVQPDQQPAIGISDQPEMRTLNCLSNKLVIVDTLPTTLERFYIDPAWNTNTVATCDITGIVAGDSFELFLRVLKLLVPDVESRKTMILKNLENPKDYYYLDSLNHFRPDLYQHLVSEVLRLSV